MKMRPASEQWDPNTGGFEPIICAPSVIGEMTELPSCRCSALLKVKPGWALPDSCLCLEMQEIGGNCCPQHPIPFLPVISRSKFKSSRIWSTQYPEWCRSKPHRKSLQQT